LSAPFNKNAAKSKTAMPPKTIHKLFFLAMFSTYQSITTTKDVFLIQIGMEISLNYSLTRKVLLFLKTSISQMIYYFRG
jgi:hypothetical protein